MVVLKKGGSVMGNKKKIKVSLGMINVVLRGVEVYLEWELSKCENEV